MKLSLVMPAYNEAAIIENSVRQVDLYLSELGLEYEIIVGDDGSADGTGDLVRALGLERVRVLALPRKGKGNALTTCLRHATGEYVGFIDSDLEIHISYVEGALNALIQGHDAAVASKTLLADWSKNRSTPRRLVTAAYNGLVRTLFGTSISDHQAGLKLFRGDRIRSMLPRIRSAGWLWDTEVLVMLSDSGDRICEIPVKTQPRDASRLGVAKSTLGVFSDLFQLYWTMRIRARWARDAASTGEATTCNDLRSLSSKSNADCPMA